MIGLSSSPAIVPQLLVDAGDSFDAAMGFGARISNSGASGFVDAEQLGLTSAGSLRLSA